MLRSILAGFCLAVVGGLMADTWRVNAQLNYHDEAFGLDADARLDLDALLTIVPAEWQPIELPDAVADGSEWLTGGLQLQAAVVSVDYRDWLRLQPRKQAAELMFSPLEQTDSAGVYMLIPVHGEVAGGWRVVWLEIWIKAPAGALQLDGVATFPPAGFTLLDGWVRLVANHPDGESAVAEGPLHGCMPLALAAAPQQDWQALAGDLSARLERRNERIMQLQEQLAGSESALARLRSVVGAMAQEQEGIVAENRRLTERLGEVDQGLLQRLDAAEAARAVAEHALAGSERERASLQRQFSDQRGELARLQVEVQRLREARRREPEPQATARHEQLGHRAAGTPAVMTIVEKPPVPEAILLQATDRLPQVSVVAEQTAAPRERMRPSKFRR